MTNKIRQTKRWSEEEELELIQLYDKYKNKENNRFQVDMVPEDKLIGGRSRSALAAKLLHEYGIRSQGVVVHRTSTRAKYMMAQDLKDGMAIDDVIDKFNTTSEIVNFVLNNVDSILAAEKTKRIQSEKKLKWYRDKKSKQTEEDTSVTESKTKENEDFNFLKPKWTPVEDMQLMKTIGPYLSNNLTVDWKSLGDTIIVSGRKLPATKKRYLNHLKSECVVKGDAIYFREACINQEAKPAKRKSTPVEATVSQPDPTPRMITKSYLWGMITVTKPV